MQACRIRTANCGWTKHAGGASRLSLEEVKVSRKAVVIQKAGEDEAQKSSKR